MLQKCKYDINNANWPRSGVIKVLFNLTGCFKRHYGLCRIWHLCVPFHIVPSLHTGFTDKGVKHAYVLACQMIYCAKQTKICNQKLLLYTFSMSMYLWTLKIPTWNHQFFISSIHKRLKSQNFSQICLPVLQYCLKGFFFQLKWKLNKIC